MREKLKPVLCFAAVFLAWVMFCVFQLVVEFNKVKKEREEIRKYTVQIVYDVSLQDTAEDTELVYRDSMEEALLAVDVFADYPYMENINKIVWEKENEEYAVLYYHAVENIACEGMVMCRFKIRKRDEGKQYALLKTGIQEFRLERIREKPLETVQKSARGFDMMAQFSIEDGRRFLWGNLRTEKVETLQIEGQSPTGIVEYSIFEKPVYFWYYEDLDSEKPGTEFLIELE